MVKRTALLLVVGIVVGASVAALPATAQVASQRPLSHDDYDDWMRIQGQRISPDGAWVLYQATPQEGDGELIVRDIVNGTEYRQARGTGARFSPASDYVVFLIAPTEESVEAAEEDDVEPEDQPKHALGIMSLADGSVTEVARVKSFALPADAGAMVAYLHEKPASEEEAEAPEEPQEAEEEPAVEEPAAEEPVAEEPMAEDPADDEEDAKDKDFGTELTVQQLAGGVVWNAASVLEYEFTDDGEHLLYVVSSEAAPDSDGVYAYAAAAGDAVAVLAGEGNYERMAWDREQTVMAFVTDRDDYAAETPTFNLYGWVPGAAAAELWVSHTDTSGFPAGMAVSHRSPVSFTDDGGMVLFGIKEIPAPEPEEDDADDDEQAVFDLWSWDDPYPQPQQEQMLERVENQTWESVYHRADGRFVQLADEAVPDVRLSNDGSVAFAQTNVPYTREMSYYGTFNDVYVIDPMSGDRTLVAEKIFRGATMSPGGRYITWFGRDDYDWYAYDRLEATTRNLTETLDARFDREDWDTPQAAGSYGSAGWLSDDEALLVYDRYDIWLLRPDGSEARMITEGYGRANDLAFRYVRLDPDADAVDPAARMLLATTNAETMATGYHWDSPMGDATPEPIVMGDRAMGRPAKAKDADMVLYTQSAFDMYPDLWAGGLDFDGTRVSHLGEQMTPFTWGEAELRDFYSADGMPLKGILVKPANFDPTRKYPLMVYIYETLHQGLHSFRHPAPGTSINQSYYASNDYVLWMPDIEYGTGYPGEDAMKCVLPGINMLINEGFIDPERIGIQGHSWGGYQISYMVTQTNIFAAAEAGAPVSNMTSAYGGIRWASGMVRQFQYEQTQSRLGASLWEVPLRYVENSPIFWADKIETPLLVLHNDDDGAVPWYQGIEFIMALRRLEKPAWMFNYNGEAHGLRQRVNQKDFTVRMQQFFDHYLKDETPPLWMVQGIKAWEKGKTNR